MLFADPQPCTRDFALERNAHTRREVVTGGPHKSQMLEDIFESEDCCFFAIESIRLAIGESDKFVKNSRGRQR